MRYFLISLMTLVMCLCISPLVIAQTVGGDDGRFVTTTVDHKASGKTKLVINCADRSTTHGCNSGVSDAKVTGQVTASYKIKTKVVTEHDTMFNSYREQVFPQKVEGIINLRLKSTKKMTVYLGMNLYNLESPSKANCYSVATKQYPIKLKKGLTVVKMTSAKVKKMFSVPADCRWRTSSYPELYGIEGKKARIDMFIMPRPSDTGQSLSSYVNSWHKKAIAIKP